MKKINYIIILLSGIFIINSCNTKDLELTSPNDLSPETFFKTEAQVEASVNATYANLQTQALYGRHLFFAMDNMSQENSGNSQLEANKRQMLEFTFDSGSDIVQFYWEACYLGIAKANFVTDNAEKINALPTSVLTQEKKNKFIAEARFMRAYYYFLLVNRFGDIPLYDKNTTDTKGLPRSPKSDVFKQIIADFDFASKNLLDKSVEQNGRATKGAAFAYLGKALLYQKKYEESLVALNNVSGYSLEPDFYDNFKEETEHGIESIFEVEFDAKLGTGSKWDGNIGPVSGRGSAEATFRGQEYGNISWFNVYPSNDLLDEYEVGDKRIAGTFYQVGDKYNKDNTDTMRVDPEADRGKPGYVNNFDSSQGTRRAGWKKYQNYYKRIKENEDSGINFKVMRYADVLLMKAECENEKAGGSQAIAVGYINEVRARSGVPALATSLSKKGVFDALIHERKVELAGEQSRFDDVIRWGIADQEINRNLNPKIFIVGKNELWPIPNREISSNPNIGKQNPGY
jgi:starch-binding outer membrane protein, SusD/RagB family